jgi:hypothetical protein
MADAEALRASFRKGVGVQVPLVVQIIYLVSMKNRKYTDEQFIEAVKSSYSIAEVLKKLNLALAGGSYKTFYATIKDRKIDISHFIGQGHLKGKKHEWSPTRKLEDILIVNSPHSKSSSLKKRLIKEGLLINKCAGINTNCGISEWHGMKLSLHLDHINGINTDNRIENLRILCPNCHSQTNTYCVKKVKKK